MSYYIGLMVLCLAGWGRGEPPVAAPYPPAGHPSASAFPSSLAGSQFQGLPEVFDGRSTNLNEPANHRIHFNLFKDHETKKSKDNISFKLNQGENQFKSGGNPNYGNNYQDNQGNKYNFAELNQPSLKYGGNSPFNLNNGISNVNRQSLEVRNHDKVTENKFGAGSQNNVPQTRYGPAQNAFDQQQPSQNYQPNYKSLSWNQEVQSQGFQSQPQFGNGNSPKYNTNIVKPSDKYGQPQSFDQSGQSSYQQSPSNFGSTRISQQNSQPLPSYGVPFQGQGSNQLRNMNQAHHLNSVDKYSNFYRQGSSSEYSENRSNIEDKTERANYEFEYEVRGEQSHGHEESREGDETWGSYRVQLPDGRTMLVEYTADDRGYRPKISYSDHQSDQQTY